MPSGNAVILYDAETVDNLCVLLFEHTDDVEMLKDQ